MATRALLRYGVPTLSAVVVAMGSLWWWDAQHRVAPLEGPFRAGGVTLKRLTLDALPVVPPSLGPELGGSQGDWALQSDVALAVVGAEGRGVERAMHFGALLDAAASDIVADRIEELRPLVRLAGRAVVLPTRTVEPDPSGSTPAIVVTQRGEGMTLRTRIWLEVGRPWVHLKSVLENGSGEAIERAQIGDRVRWPGDAPFAPGLGFVTTDRTGRARWLGRSTNALGYALVFLEGEAEIEFETDRIGPSEQRAFGKPFRLEPGKSVSYERVLVMSPSGLVGAAENAWVALAQPFGSVSGATVPPEPSARIEVQRPDGTPELETTPEADGHFRLAVPPGRYRVVLDAPGGRHVQDVEVRRGDRTELTLLPPRAGAVRISVADARGAPMPARVTFTGRHPTPTPNLGTKQRAAGIANVAYTHDGQLNVEVPPGSYTVRVTRGPEYAVFEKNVDITAERGQALQVSLARVVDTPGWIGADLHVHAAPSPDSSVTLEDRVTSLAGEGVEVAVATDHNHVTDYASAIDKRNLVGALRGITGVEITTVGWGHFNCYPYPGGERPPQFAGVVPWEIFADARALSPRSLIQVNHPRMSGIGYFRRLELSSDKPPRAEEGFSFDFDTLEVVNGFDLESPSVIEASLRDWFTLLDYGYAYTAVGNSDSHNLAFQWPGSPRTYVAAVDDRPEAVTAGEIASALLKGRAVISNGVFATVRVAGVGEPGDLVPTERGRALVEVTARAAPWVDVSRVELWVNGSLALKTALPRKVGARGIYGLRHELVLERDSWIVAIVRGDRPLGETFPEARGTPLAIVNPVFVDFDGDGRFQAPRAPVPVSDESEPEPPASSGRLPWERGAASGEGTAGAGP